jgi:hypothetical protein
VQNPNKNRVFLAFCYLQANTLQVIVSNPRELLEM